MLPVEQGLLVVFEHANYVIWCRLCSSIFIHLFIYKKGKIAFCSKISKKWSLSLIKRKKHCRNVSIHWNLKVNRFLSSS